MQQSPLFGAKYGSLTSDKKKIKIECGGFTYDPMIKLFNLIVHLQS